MRYALCDLLRDMINFQNVSKVYYSDGKRQTVALEDVTLEISKGEFVSLVGRSGAGKTTLLKLLLGEDRPSKGRVFFDKQEIARLKPRDLPGLRRRIGMVFQDFRLLPNLSAFENVAFAMEVVGRSRLDIKRDVPQILDLVGLADRAKNYPRELSGGEQQRVAIARALAHRPDVIVADEPTGNLDHLNSWEVIRLLTKINEFGHTVILATHNKEIVDSLGRRVVTVEDGRVIRDEEVGKYSIT